MHVISCHIILLLTYHSTLFVWWWMLSLIKFSHISVYGVYFDLFAYLGAFHTDLYTIISQWILRSFRKIPTNLVIFKIMLITHSSTLYIFWNQPSKFHGKNDLEPFWPINSEQMACLWHFFLSTNRVYFSTDLGLLSYCLENIKMKFPNKHPVFC